METMGSQYQFGRAQKKAEHKITTRVGPLYRMAFCSCGWQAQVMRGPNALGQSSKLRGLINTHFKTVE